MEAHAVDVSDVSSNGQEELPDFIVVGESPRIAPNELRVLKAITGKTLEALMNDDVDALQVMVWTALRRAGYHPTWEQAGDIDADMSGMAVDPSIGGDSTTSPPSVISGE